MRRSAITARCTSEDQAGPVRTGTEELTAIDGEAGQKVIDPPTSHLNPASPSRRFAFGEMCTPGLG
jgi:hypothetical protein